MTDPLTYLDEVDARAEAATGGPWVWRGDSFDDEEHSCPHGTEWTDHGPDLETVAQEPPYSDGSQSAVASVITSFGYDASGLTVKQADAEFIAHARQDLPALSKALRAVLALHRPIAIVEESNDGPMHTGNICAACSLDSYPCPTVQAIQAALAVNDEGGTT